jgi:hypothetical protein
MFVYRNNILLSSAGCKGEEIGCFQKLGMCSHKNTLRNLQTAMGKDFDKPVAEWKVRLEENFKKHYSLKNFCKNSVLGLALAVTTTWKRGQLTFRKTPCGHTQISLKEFMICANPVYHSRMPFSVVPVTY